MFDFVCICSYILKHLVWTFFLGVASTSICHFVNQDPGAQVPTNVTGMLKFVIVGEDTQIDDQDNLALMDAGHEEIYDESNIRPNVEVQTGISEQVGSNGGQEFEVEVEEFIEAEQRKVEGRVTRRSSLMKSMCLESLHNARYLLPIEKEGEFSVSDMVWGKVRSHPWWPGQIFDPSDSSEKAMKHYKKDCHLVAYFGDRTFAWNEESQLKPFRTHFSSIEKQSTSESFQNAVDCAVDEVTRRAEYRENRKHIQTGANSGKDTNIKNLFVFANSDKQEQIRGRIPTSKTFMFRIKHRRTQK